MPKFFIAALLVLHFLPGNAETEGEEEITKFLYDYASHLSDYYYATVEYYSENTTLIYYSENTTLIPTIYSYEVFEESVASPLRCHLPFIILLSLLGLLL